MEKKTPKKNSSARKSDVSHTAHDKMTHLQKAKQYGKMTTKTWSGTDNTG
jgi:hypothetical protein